MGNESSSSRRSAEQVIVPQQRQTQQSTSAGAMSVPGNGNDPSQPRFRVTIPRGVVPGQHFAVLVNGQQMMVRCPPGSRENDQLIITAPRQASQQFVVTVPQGVRSGEQFRVTVNGQEVLVTCPPGVRVGQRATFQLPTPERAPPQVAPNHQMFEVVVPEGVQPGQPFALIANNQRVMVTCPPNVRTGQKIRFQLPIQLSQAQLEAIRVDYDKDGWMRCLGQDLKFHWVYNQNGANKSIRDDTFNENGTQRGEQVVAFDVDGTAMVRQITVASNGKLEIEFLNATEYSVETTVKGTNVNYQELSNISRLPFQQKVDWLKNQFSQLRIPWAEGHMKVKVRRSSLLVDSMEAMCSVTQPDMRKLFRFEFLGEPGLDAGGVAREWYMLVSEQLFNPDCGLFHYSSVNQMCMQINPNSGIANEHHLRYFHLAGRVLGKALMDGQITPVHLVQPLYKHLMGWPMTMNDIEHIDNMVHRNLLGLLHMEDINMLCLDFTVTEDQLGVTQTINLISGGDNIEVSADNLPQYLREQLKYRLFTRIKPQLSEFLRGFYDVVPEPLLSVFDYQELELVLHGLPNIDMNDWKSNTEYTGEFANNHSHRVIQWFWEIVTNYSHENRAKLLQFTTGTAGVPSRGFGFLQGNDGNIRRFTLHGVNTHELLPRSHTCFNRLDVPLYKSKADAQKYITMAITLETSGFGIE